MSSVDSPISVEVPALGKRAELMLRVGAPRAAAHADEISAVLRELGRAPAGEYAKRLGSISGVEALAVLGTVSPEQRESTIEHLSLDDAAKLRLARLVHDLGHAGDKQSAAAALASMFPDVTRQSEETPDESSPPAPPDIEGSPTKSQPLAPARESQGAAPQLDDEQLASVAAKIATWEPPDEARKLLWKLLPPCLQFGSPFSLDFWKSAAARVKDDCSPEEASGILLLGKLISRMGDVKYAAALYDGLCNQHENQRLSVAAKLELARIQRDRGEFDEALQLLEQAEQLTTTDRDWAVVISSKADTLQERGELDEALRIRREEVMPVYKRLGDVRGQAITRGKIADILQERGELDEALRIRKQEVMPAFQKLADPHFTAVESGKIADILRDQRKLDEALRIRREEQMPVYERLGDVRSQAVTWGKIADILQAKNQLDEALRIRQEEEMPVYERLGDVRLRAITWGQIADILQARGALDEALRIRQEEQIPAFKRLADAYSLLVTQTQIAMLLRQRNAPGDAEQARVLLQQALEAAERMRLSEAGEIRGMLEEA